MFPVYPPRWWAPSPCSCAGRHHTLDPRGRVRGNLAAQHPPTPSLLALALTLALALALTLTRPHNAVANNVTTTLAQGSQAFTALAFLAATLELLPVPIADIAGVVMWAQIASVAYLVCNQLGDILKVLGRAVVTMGHAVTRVCRLSG